ncbi:MAG: hypothetical protein SCJ94_12175 [Bacillota bacterium]|nr:hypothetical protein [Bacillota bacterium]
MALAASRDGFKLFRFPLQGKRKVIFDAALMMHPIFIQSFIRSLSVFFTCYRDLPLKRKILSSFIASKVKFLRRKKDWYIRDQGYFQFGDWVPESVNKNVRLLMQALDKIDGTSDAVIFFDVPSEVVYEKLRRRGDAGTWENRALERGYASLLDRIKDQNNDNIIKYDMCK